MNPSTQSVEFVVIGGGPCGLGAALELEDRRADYHLIEATEQFGGLASSWVDENGFTWDIGGHVQFSHYATFDRFMDLALGIDGWWTLQRESWVWIRERFVPYPFQNNLHRLDAGDRWSCIEGLLEVTERSGEPTPSNFKEWMLATFGRGITALFMEPYNFKVWAYPPERMGYQWIGERVAIPPLRQVLRSLCTGEDEVSWGPNAVFRFPKRGGTGAIWSALGARLPAERVSLEAPVQSIDARNHLVVLADGRQWRYRYLISSMPLSKLVSCAPGVWSSSCGPETLGYSSTHVVGIGVNGRLPEHLQQKCWMYFPELNSPYYRVTVFSNYSPNNVPDPESQYSLLTETSESQWKPVEVEKLAAETLRALREDGLLPPDAEVVSVAQRRLELGYPTPFLGRDAVVDPIIRRFEQVDIFSRGRFGAWKYEVANQDHSFAQGYECVRRLLSGAGEEAEPTLHSPSVVNSRRNP